MKEINIYKEMWYTLKNILTIENNNIIERIKGIENSFMIKLRNESRTIKIWRWEDAPQEYKDLSEHSGDEDWVAFVPDSLNIEYIFWMNEGTIDGYVKIKIEDFNKL